VVPTTPCCSTRRARCPGSRGATSSSCGRAALHQRRELVDRPRHHRDCILTLARAHDLPVVVRSFTREELLRADEVFLTGTAAEVTPVRALDGVEFPTGKRTFGALFQRAYLRAVTGKTPEHADWLTPVT
jgi:hypothetical protein